MDFKDSAILSRFRNARNPARRRVARRRLDQTPQVRIVHAVCGAHDHVQMVGQEYDRVDVKRKTAAGLAKRMPEKASMFGIGEPRATAVHGQHEEVGRARVLPSYAGLHACESCVADGHHHPPPTAVVHPKNKVYQDAPYPAFTLGWWARFSRDSMWASEQEDETVMGTCIAVVSDMIFATRITSTAAKVGAKCRTVNGLGALQNALESEDPTTVLVDMNCEGVSPVEAIRMVKSHCPSARVVAFFSHVQTELMEQATEAGADDVWPRSAFVQRLPKVLEASIGPGA